MAPVGAQEQIELREFFLNNNLKEIFKDIDNLEKYFNCEDINDVIDVFTLTNILNKIAESEAGCNILKALKSALGNPPDNKKIVFKVCDQVSEINKALNEQQSKVMGIMPSDKEILKKAGVDGDLTLSSLENIIKTNVLGTSKEAQGLKQVLIDEKNKCSFQSDLAFQNGRLQININKDFISEERYIFDKNKITTHKFPANKTSEAYFIAHELTHVVSFLNSGVTNDGDWKLRKGELTEKENALYKIKQDAGWVDFFNETDQMQEIYHGLLLDGFPPKQIIDTFRTFFLNTEEARNVLGLVKGTVDNQETFIGEGTMFKELNPSNEGIITYLGEEKQPQTDIEKAILRRLTDDRSKINLEQQDALTVLGSQFEGFNLVNVPRENSAIEAIKKADQSLKSKDFSQEIEIIDNQVNFTMDFQRNFAREYISQNLLKSQTEFGNLSIIAQRAEKPIVVVQSDEKKPSQYTFKKFDTNGQITPCEGTLQQIREQKPNAVFIYYNGVNHLQALVPQQPA